MLKRLLIVGLAVLTAACVPIPPLPPEAATETEASAETETADEMLGQLESCDPEYSIVTVGQGVDDLPTTDVPDYVDIVREESSLDGETLTVVFYLKNLPKEMTVKREGISDLAMDSDGAETASEYYWNVNIDVHGVAQNLFNNSLFDYMFSANISPGPLVSKSPPTIDFEEALHLEFFEFEHNKDGHSISFLNHVGPAQLDISYEDNSLTFSSRVPGITDNSTLFFYTIDVLLGHDGISCES